MFTVYITCLFISKNNMKTPFFWIRNIFGEIHEVCMYNILELSRYISKQKYTSRVKV